MEGGSCTGTGDGSVSCGGGMGGGAMAASAKRCSDWRTRYLRGDGGVGVTSFAMFGKDGVVSLELGYVSDWSNCVALPAVGSTWASRVRMACVCMGIMFVGRQVAMRMGKWSV